MEKPKKIITPLVALQKAEAFCAYQERCQQEVRDKLYALDQESEMVEGIIVELIEHNFLNEERFALAYAKGKFRQKHWGRLKIKQGLKFKRISDYLIKKALASIDAEEYEKVLLQVLTKAKAAVKEKEPYKIRYKLIAKAISQGFEADIINDSLKQMDLEEEK